MITHGLTKTRRYARDTPNDVSTLIEGVMYWTNVAFFGLAGASLKLVRALGSNTGNACFRKTTTTCSSWPCACSLLLRTAALTTLPHTRHQQNALAGAIWVALLVVAVRLLAIIAGCWAGCRAGGVRQEHRNVFWLSQITQVGGYIPFRRAALLLKIYRRHSRPYLVFRLPCAGGAS